MSDVIDQRIAELHITEEVLEKLGITADCSARRITERGKRVEEYGKYFRQLWKLIHEPSEE